MKKKSYLRKKKEILKKARRLKHINHKISNDIFEDAWWLGEDFRCRQLGRYYDRCRHLGIYY